jgi:hypothetical protein
VSPPTFKGFPPEQPSDGCRSCCTLPKVQSGLRSSLNLDLIDPAVVVAWLEWVVVLAVVG